MKVLVVDDEAPARERLRRILDDLDGYEFAGEASNGEQALAMINASRPDVVLLDIRMPGIDGIQTAHHLNAMDHPPAVVFTTAYDEYAIDAFEARAIGYVLKPVRAKRLAAALEHASRLAAPLINDVAEQSGIASKREHICASTQGRLLLIPLDEIDVFRADQKYVSVSHAGGETLIDESLKALEKEFGDDFVRIHRSALVALSSIDRIEKTADGKSHVILRNKSHGDGNALIISRRHVADVRRRLRKG